MSGRAIIALTRCGIRRHGKTAAGSLGFIAFTTGGARPSMPHTRDNPDARHSSLALTRGFVAAGRGRAAVCPGTTSRLHLAVRDGRGKR